MVAVACWLSVCLQAGSCRLTGSSLVEKKDTAENALGKPPRAAGTGRPAAGVRAGGCRGAGAQKSGSAAALLRDAPNGCSAKPDSPRSSPSADRGPVLSLYSVPLHC